MPQVQDTKVGLKILTGSYN